MTRCWKRITALTLMAGLLAVSAHAQGGRRGGFFPAPPPQPVSNGELDAKGIKQALDRVLKTYPPSLTQVLQLDPSLLTEASYLTSYPKLATFLKEHPAVVHNTPYYIGTLKPPTVPKPTVVYQNAPRAYDTVTYYVVILTLLAIIAWMIRATVEQRRMIQTSRVSMEAQMKILERFASNEDLLKFIQTPAGQRFLETASMQTPARAVAVPITQILRSTQIGCVLIAGGVTLQLRIIDFMNYRFLSGIGVIAIAMGTGFLVSAFSAYNLSRKLGLLNSSDVTSHTPSS
jgi:hypothetical protein